MKARQLQKITLGLMLLTGIFVVARWKNRESAALLAVAAPVFYGLTNLVSKRTQIVTKLQSSPLWFAVSKPRAYGRDFLYGRTFEWDEDLARIHAAQDYSKEDIYQMEVGSGLSWFSGDKVGQFLDFHSGVRTNVLEMESDEACFLTRECREYLTSSRKCFAYSVLGWAGVCGLLFVSTFEEAMIALGIAIWVVVLWGVLPHWSMRDRTEDWEFLCHSHIHVYTYYPADGERQERYSCPCGKTEIPV